MHNLGWGWWLIMSIGMVAFWALVVYAIVALARGAWLLGGEKPEPPVQEPPETPKDILDRRLASGELSVEEYRERLAALEGRQPAGAGT